MSLAFPTHDFRPARARAVAKAPAGQSHGIISRLRWPLILGLGLNLLLWVGLAEGVRALMSA